ncbi:IS3 family transposase [Corynebacterium striatum]|uniref:IS3 family transposase n=1 Tax=Corynebacterium striatum TaxID=43770 RepID=UPI00351FE734
MVVDYLSSQPNRAGYQVSTKQGSGPRSWIHYFTRLPQATTRVPSARALSDNLLIPEIQRVHAENFSVYGIRKMWHAMNREGFHIGRDKTARLMKLAGVSGRRRGRTPVTTISPKV